MRQISSLAAALLWTSAMVSPAAAVTATTVTAGVAIASLSAAGAIVTSGAGVITFAPPKWYNSLAGLLIAAGGVTIGAIDPPSGTFLNGQFTIQYPANLVQVTSSGWLGDWGVNASLQPPPSDPFAWSDGMTIALQNPAAGLTAKIDNTVSGLQTVSFDWGPSGHPIDDPLNVFASAFEAKTDLNLTFLGTAAAPPAGANFFVSSAQFQCSLPTIPPTVSSCGETQTSYFSMVVVPGPIAGAGLSGLIAACGALLILARRRRQLVA
jgi:hypothetical protein